MRLSALVLFAAACGGSGKSPEPVQPVQPAPAPVEPRRPPPHTDGAPAPQGLGSARAEPAPMPAPPPPVPKGPIYDRLLDTDGDVDGLTGFSTRRVRDPKRCGGFSILTKRGKKIAPTDAKIAAVFALEYPLGLDYSEKKQEGSRLKFRTFLENMAAAAGPARLQYEAEFASLDPAVKAAAAARLTQLYVRLSSLVARGEIPVDVRTGDLVDEKTTAFCEALEDQAETMLELATQALDACRRLTIEAPAGWWAELCKAP